MRDGGVFKRRRRRFRPVCKLPRLGVSEKIFFFAKPCLLGSVSRFVGEIDPNGEGSFGALRGHRVAVDRGSVVLALDILQASAERRLISFVIALMICAIPSASMSGKV